MKCDDGFQGKKREGEIERHKGGWGDKEKEEGSVMKPCNQIKRFVFLIRPLLL
jgi:hypothetical protein